MRSSILTLSSIFICLIHWYNSCVSLKASLPSMWAVKCTPYRQSGLCVILNGWYIWMKNEKSDICKIWAWQVTFSFSLFHNFCRFAHWLCRHLCGMCSCSFRYRFILRTFLTITLTVTFLIFLLTHFIRSLTSQPKRLNSNKYLNSYFCGATVYKYADKKPKTRFHPNNHSCQSACLTGEMRDGCFSGCVKTDWLKKSCSITINEIMITIIFFKRDSEDCVSAKTWASSSNAILMISVPWSYFHLDGET